MSDPISAGLGLIDTFIGKFVKDKDLAAKLLADANSQEMAGEINARLGQIEVNKIQAASGSIFVSGARPFIMWVCGFALAYNTIASPILDIWLEVPEIDSGLLYPVLTALLGFGGMRSWEKSKGVARSSLRNT